MTGSLHADVVVVGGGIGGVSVASELARDRAVVVVEAEPELGLHATGRSAASYVPSYGPPMVRRLTAASLADFEALAAEGGRPLLIARPVLYVAGDFSAGALEGLLTAQVHGPVRGLGVDDALALCPVLRPETLVAAAIDETASDLDVDGVLQAFAARLRARGGRVLLGSPVTSIRRRRGGWTVEAGSTRILAGALVDAAGAWADPVARMAGLPALGIRPRRRSILLGRGRGGATGRLPFTLAADESFYFKDEGEAVLVSPADATPVVPHDARPDEVECARAIEAVNAMTTLGIRSVARSWAGLRSFAADGEPVAGGLGGAGAGFHWLAAQGGYGLQSAPALARLAAALVRGEEVPADLAAHGVDAAALAPARLLRRLPRSA